MTILFNFFKITFAIFIFFILLMFSMSFDQSKDLRDNYIKIKSNGINTSSNFNYFGDKIELDNGDTYKCYNKPLFEHYTYYKYKSNPPVLYSNNILYVNKKLLNKMSFEKFKEDLLKCLKKTFGNNENYSSWQKYIIN